MFVDCVVDTDFGEAAEVVVSMADVVVVPSDVTEIEAFTNKATNKCQM